MARGRRNSRGRNGNGLTPGTHVTLNLTQALMVVCAIAVTAGGYWFLVDNQNAQGKDIAEIKTTVTNATKDQDNKREQLGKDFLASNQKIADKVGDLNAAVLVQQATAKTMADTLAHISDQLSTAIVTPGARRKANE